MKRIRARAIWLVLLGIVSSTTVLSASDRSPTRNGSESNRDDLIECWWQTSSGAVRVGEPFVLLLTCSFLETNSLRVVPDQSTLDPKSLQLPPYDILDGSQQPDEYADSRHFFQYRYRLRLLNDALIAKDVGLPAIRIPYRVRNTTAQGEVIDGRENTYLLPSMSLRLLSLVPVDASDIRESPASTFSDIDERSFHGTILQLIGGVLVGVSVLLTIIALAKLFGHYRAKHPETNHLVSDYSILGEVQRELSAIEQQRITSDWTGELVARTLIVLRILSGYALSRPVTQLVANRKATGTLGALAVSGGMFSRGESFVLATITPADIVRALARESQSDSRLSVEQLQRLEALRTALEQFTRAQYGRQQPPEQLLLDRSLSFAIALSKQLWQENLTSITYIVRKSNQLKRRLWSQPGRLRMSSKL